MMVVRRVVLFPFFCACSVCGLLVVLFSYCLAAPPAADTISFLWAFGSRAGATATTAPGAITQDTVLHTGDQFKMLVQLQKPCFVYVLYHSAEQVVDLLFPSTMQQFETDYVLGKRYEIPPKEAWYTLTPPARRESISVLASPTRL